ncbi:hypothetical protein [Haloarchaeobius sp. HRN-SO-5]|uniref:hypothetical protein n=1 Tax=Haloarchaeobius sp. HRN-SO-5 TaxID=3446118 RepID=UPI003EBB3A0B
MKQATRALLVDYAKRYSVVAGGALSTTLLFAGSQYLPLTLRGTSFFVALGSLFLAPLPLAASNAGLESASTSVSGGFDVTNPSAARGGSAAAGSLRLKVTFVPLGTGLYALAGFLLLGWT